MHVVYNEPYISPMQPKFIVWYLCMHTKSLRPGMDMVSCYEVWEEMTHPLPNFNGCTVTV